MQVSSNITLNNSRKLANQTGYRWDAYFGRWKIGEVIIFDAGLVRFFGDSSRGKDMQDFDSLHSFWSSFSGDSPE